MMLQAGQWLHPDQSGRLDHHRFKYPEAGQGWWSPLLFYSRVDLKLPTPADITVLMIRKQRVLSSRDLIWLFAWLSGETSLPHPPIRSCPTEPLCFDLLSPGTMQEGPDNVWSLGQIFNWHTCHQAPGPALGSTASWEGQGSWCISRKPNSGHPSAKAAHKTKPIKTRTSGNEPANLDDCNLSSLMNSQVWEPLI